MNFGGKYHPELTSLRQEIIDQNLHAKAIVQDILAFRGSILELENLNEAGRNKIQQLRKCINKLEEYARDEGDTELLKESESHKEQLNRTLQSFRRANISTMLEIEKLETQELFKPSGDPPVLRARGTNKASKSSLVSQQDSVTEKMLSISRHLSETTQKSAFTLETLISSSSNVEATRDELLMTAGTITQSGKLLNKYGRRECTDKILLFFAFTFFLACVFYIVQKRLF